MRSQRRGRGVRLVRRGRDVRLVRREIGVRLVRRVKSVSSRRRASGFLCESWQEWRDGDDENLSTRTGCRLQMMPVSTEHKHSSQARVAQATSCPPTLAIPPPPWVSNGHAAGFASLLLGDAIYGGSSSHRNASKCCPARFLSTSPPTRSARHGRRVQEESLRRMYHESAPPAEVAPVE